MQGVGGKTTGRSFVHDNDARAGADLPAPRVIYPIHRLLIHEEEGVTVFLDTGLQAIGGGYRPVLSVRPVVNKENSFASLRPKDEPCFDYIRKNKNGRRFRFDFGGRRILRHELIKSC